MALCGGSASQRLFSERQYWTKYKRLGRLDLDWTAARYFQIIHILYNFGLLLGPCDQWPPRRDEDLFGKILKIVAINYIQCHRHGKFCPSLRSLSWLVTDWQTLPFESPCGMWPRSWFRWCSNITEICRQRPMEWIGRNGCNGEKTAHCQWRADLNRSRIISTPAGGVYCWW
jgi:hypothetical protein